ncbi:MAG: universal stress protein [Gammaproteobacteria bacterium]|nr:universal stress protein [Gammaproteobacteria bacterium]
MFTSIVVAIDGSSHSLRALAFSAELAADSNANLGIIYVVESSVSGLPRDLLEMSVAEHIIDPSPNLFTRLESTQLDTFKSAMDAAQQSQRLVMQLAEHIIEDAVRNAKVDGAEKITRYIGTGKVVDEILSFASKQNADVIVTGQRGMGALKSMLLGSTSLKLAQTAPCTSIIVK